MSKTTCYFSSTIGRKQLMAVVGLGLCGFVLAHVLGNFLMFVGPEAYNRYGHGIITNPLIKVAEAGLVVMFLLHVFLGISVSILNRKSRETKYAVSATGDKGASLASRTMLEQGLVILVFVILHLITFKFGPVYDVTYDGVVMRDLFRLMHEVFQSPIYVGGYVFAMAVLTLHLSHGLKSSLQTLGAHHPKYECKLKMVSCGYGLFVGLGFMIQPIYMMFFYSAAN